MTPLALSISDLSAGYGKHSVLDGIDLNVSCGEWHCLLGPNGSGKSTLLHCIVGWLVPSRGDVKIVAQSILAQPLNAKRSLGFACPPENLPLLLTGRQCLETYAAAKGVDKVSEEVIELAEKLGFTKWIDKYVDTYSLGTRQKLCVLLAMIGDPELIVLDEAFNGLDPASALVLKRFLQTKICTGKCAVILATHSLDIVEHYATNASLLLGGRVVKEWDRQAIDELRVCGANALEESLASITTVS